jgi:hypothetical protein
MRPSDAESVEAREKNNTDTSVQLLKAMVADPAATQADWATAIQKSKSTANDHLQKLKKLGLAPKTPVNGAPRKEEKILLLILKPMLFGERSGAEQLYQSNKPNKKPNAACDKLLRNHVFGTERTSEQKPLSSRCSFGFLP